MGTGPPSKVLFSTPHMKPRSWEKFQQCIWNALGDIWKNAEKLNCFFPPILFVWPIFFMLPYSDDVDNFNWPSHLFPNNSTALMRWESKLLSAYESWINGSAFGTTTTIKPNIDIDRSSHFNIEGINQFLYLGSVVTADGGTELDVTH